MWMVLFSAGCVDKPSLLLTRLCFDETCFRVEKARTPGERQQGLMYRNSLGRDRGMLFIFEQEDIYPFWMKNTKIPLDMLWLDSRRKVVEVMTNVPPCEQDPCPVYTPPKKAVYVLELSAGTVERKKISVGSTASF
jgi:uncharacterized membrane protein (UPF0127 family)